MGSAMSLSWCKNKTTGQDKGNASGSCKRRRICLTNEEASSRLIPSLPDELSIQILARLPRICHFNARLVSRKWKSTLISSELYGLRKEFGITEEWLYLLVKDKEDKLMWYALDPLFKKWQRLPPMAGIVYEEESQKGFSNLWNIVNPNLKVIEIVKNWIGRKDPLEQKQFCGCSIGAVEGSLYVIGGFSKSHTMNSVWRFDPILNKWSKASSMLVSRAYSKTGVVNNKLYVVGGVNDERRGVFSLRSAEVYDPNTDMWSEVPNMPFSKVQMLPNVLFSDLLNPIVTGMSTYNGKLCVSQSLYTWPFFVDVGGEIYDPETKSWDEMPAGMGEGWPGKQAGTKLSAVVDGELYAYDPSSSSSSSSMENGKIKVYDQKDDAWKVVIKEVPVYAAIDSESPCLLAGFHGKLHIIARDRNSNITVLRADVADNPLSDPCSLIERSDLDDNSDAIIWKIIASKQLGASELVNCQVIGL